MKNQKTNNTEMIVLHTTKTGESAMVLHTLSRDYGRKSFIIKGLGSSRSRKNCAASLLLPMSIIEAEVVESDMSSLYSARALTSAVPLVGLRNDFYKNTITLFLSEVLFKTLKEGMNEEGLYDWCRQSILILNEMQSDFANFHLRFLLELTVALGFSPAPQDICPFIPEHQPVILKLMQSQLAESMLIPLSGKARNEIADGLIRYIEYHIESPLNINSLKVLREIFI